MHILAGLGAFLAWVVGVLFSLFLSASKSAAIALGLAVALSLAFYYVGIDLFITFLNMIFIFVSNLVSDSNLDSESFNFMNEIRKLDSQTLNLLAYLGFGECVKIIASALMTRMILNLIPFVRL